MNAVERVKQICKQRKIAISKLESDCGFANGYIGQLRKGTFPDDRLNIISKYLGVSPTYLMTGEEISYSKQADLLIALRHDKDLMEALKKYVRLSEEKKKHIIDNINMISKE